MEFCDKAIAKESSDEALILKSILLHNKKESAKSISMLSEIIARSPQFNKALLARGQIYEEISEFHSAISDYINLKKSDIIYKNNIFLQVNLFQSLQDQIEYQLTFLIDPNNLMLHLQFGHQEQF